MTFRMRGDALGRVAVVTVCVKSGSKRSVDAVDADPDLEMPLV